MSPGRKDSVMRRDQGGKETNCHWTTPNANRKAETQDHFGRERQLSTLQQNQIERGTTLQQIERGQQSTLHHFVREQQRRRFPTIPDVNTTIPDVNNSRGEPT